MKIDVNKKIGICSPSWSGPGEYPHVFKYGLEKIEEIFRMKTYLSTHAADKGFVSPQDRAADLHELFLDESIGMIFASIGGSDSVELLPYLNLNLIKENSKPLIGFSDTTTLLMYLQIHANIPTFHGPSVMAGFAEPSGIHENILYDLQSLFLGEDIYHKYKNPSTYINEDNNWESQRDFLASNPQRINYEGWEISGATTPIEGRLYGGSLETLKRMKDQNRFDFPSGIWNGSILFLETSEEKPDINNILKEIDDYENRGILNDLNGLLFGQLSYRTHEEKKEFMNAIKNRVVNDYEHSNLVLIQNLNIGHIRPQWILPIGSYVAINPSENSFVLHKDK